MQFRSAQGGGTIFGMVLGLAVGVTVAVVVAFWFGKQSPVVNKMQPKGSLSEAEETSKNKSWDPNAALFGKAVPPSLQTTAASAALAASAAGGEAEGLRPEPKLAPVASSPSASALAPASSKDPVGDLLKAKAKAAAANSSASAPAVKPAAKVETFSATAKSALSDTGVYFVQIGAFKSPEDANAQKAKLALLGVDTRVTEREQSGKTVYRVRAGIFKKVEEAEAMKAKLDKAGFDTVLVKAPV